MKRKRKALVVGINHYLNGITPLNCAADDAAELKVALRDGFSKKNIQMLLDDKAVSMRDAAAEMADSLGKDDVFVFYFSGHGCELDGKHYLLTTEAHNNVQMIKDRVGMVDLASIKRVTDIPGLLRIFILDCCRNDILKSSHKGVETDCISGYSNSKGIVLKKMSEADESMPNIIPPFILTACDENECAFEDTKAQQGFFTQVLIETLQDKKVTSLQRFSEVFQKKWSNEDLQNKIRAFCHGSQNPCWRGSLSRTLPLMPHWSGAIPVEAPAVSVSAPEQAFAPDPRRITLDNAKQAILEHDGVKAESLLKECGSYPPALNVLGRLCEEGKLLKRDLTRAFACYTDSAKQGNAEGEYLLGLALFSKRFGKQDIAKAFEYFRKSAEQNFPEALYMAGICCEDGCGTRQDIELAANYYRRSADLGVARAQYCFALCCSNAFGKTAADEALAVEYYTKAAKQGYYRAQCNLGYCYAHGVGVKKDLGKAVEYYAQAAKQGHKVAQNNLASHMERGEGCQMDPEKAFYWYGISAQGSNRQQNVDDGYEIAQYNLGRCYADGIGVAKDPVMAVKWYEKAAVRGVTGAQLKLAECLEKGIGCTANPIAAQEWYKVAGKKDK